jgi:hypothetical protein
MKRDQINVNVKVNDDGDVKVTIAEEAFKNMPVVGRSIYVVEPYNADDDEDENDSPKEKPIKAYSFAPIFVKSTVLNDEADEVLVNGDYRIPLYKDTTETNKRQLVFNNEDVAYEKWETLMTASLKEAERRTKRAQNIEEYVREALEKVHH